VNLATPAIPHMPAGRGSPASGLAALRRAGARHRQAAVEDRVPPLRPGAGTLLPVAHQPGPDDRDTGSQAGHALPRHEHVRPRLLRNACARGCANDRFVPPAMRPSVHTASQGDGGPSTPATRRGPPPARPGRSRTAAPEACPDLSGWAPRGRARAATSRVTADHAPSCAGAGARSRSRRRGRSWATIRVRAGASVLDGRGPEPRSASSCGVEWVIGENHVAESNRWRPYSRRAALVLRFVLPRPRRSPALGLRLIANRSSSAMSKATTSPSCGE
jgi:hypothetical protein